MLAGGDPASGALSRRSPYSEINQTRQLKRNLYLGRGGFIGMKNSKKVALKESLARRNSGGLHQLAADSSHHVHVWRIMAVAVMASDGSGVL